MSVADILTNVITDHFQTEGGLQAIAGAPNWVTATTVKVYRNPN